MSREMEAHSSGFLIAACRVAGEMRAVQREFLSSGMDEAFKEACEAATGLVNALSKLHAEVSKETSKEFWTSPLSEG